MPRCASLPAVAVLILAALLRAGRWWCVAVLGSLLGAGLARADAWPAPLASPVMQVEWQRADGASHCESYCKGSGARLSKR